MQIISAPASRAAYCRRYRAYWDVLASVEIASLQRRGRWTLARRKDRRAKQARKGDTRHGVLAWVVVADTAWSTVVNNSRSAIRCTPLSSVPRQPLQPAPHNNILLYLPSSMRAAPTCVPVCVRLGNIIRTYDSPCLPYECSLHTNVCSTFPRKVIMWSFGHVHRVPEKNKPL